MKKDRPKQQLPEELVADLMGAIRGAFYGSATEKRWFQDQGFIRRKVVCWPAGWLISRGVTLRPERYKEIVLGVVTTIKRHGDTGTVRYWPGYLLHCLQTHFQCHGDEIYEEAKSVRTALENALGRAAAARNGEGGGCDVVAVLAAARKIGAPRRRGRKMGRQLEFL